jgi:hypothetical protein
MRAERFRRANLPSKVLYHRLQAIFRGMRLRIVVAIITIFAILLIFFALFWQTERVRSEPSTNSFYEIVIPPPFHRPESGAFKYRGLLSSGGKCLNRSVAAHEFVRALGTDLAAKDLTTPQMLIVGASTAVGAALARTFSERDVPFIAVNGIQAIDFSSRDARRLFNGISLKRAFVVYQPPVIRHSTTDGSKEINQIVAAYVNRLTEFLRDRDVPFVFAPIGPIHQTCYRPLSKTWARWFIFPILWTVWRSTISTILSCGQSASVGWLGALQLSTPAAQMFILLLRAMSATFC